MTSWYNKRILPKCTDWACRQRPNMKQREKIIPRATGEVLEIGIGTGLNLSYYDPDKVKAVIGIDPSIEMWKLHEDRADDSPVSFEFVQASADQIPVETAHIDTVVVTYTLCSISEIEASFDEIKRVLKPTGQLLFCEHGRAPDKSVRHWQNAINPIWKRVGGGCNLNLDIPDIIQKNGFRIDQLETMYIPGWKPACFNFWGNAYVW